MKMRVMIAVGVAAAIGLAVNAVGMGSKAGTDSGKKDVGMEKKAMARPVFACTDCDTVAMKAGACPKCGKAMVESHVLGVKDGQAMLCSCPTGCKCDAAGIKDGKCACGKVVGKVSVKGMYACPMPCPEVSDQPGKCAHCGMELKKIE